jgi:DNA-directed RNA polymerase specialized sigma24 family protein
VDSLEQVLAKVAKGDRQAFREIYSRTSPQLFAMVRALMRNRERSEEILQEAFIRIWRNADKFDPAKGSAIAWLATLTRRVAIDDLRRRPEPVCSFDADDALLNSLTDESAAAPELAKDVSPFASVGCARTIAGPSCSLTCRGSPTNNWRKGSTGRLAPSRPGCIVVWRR